MRTDGLYGKVQNCNSRAISIALKIRENHGEEVAASRDFPSFGDVRKGSN